MDDLDDIGWNRRYLGSKDGSELQMLRRRLALLERLQGEKALASELGALAMQPAVGVASQPAQRVGSWKMLEVW